MSPKAQHRRRYRPLPALLRELREDAELSQRELGSCLKKPQSWIYNCESANRRVDATEFIDWARACGVDPLVAFERLVQHLD